MSIETRRRDKDAALDWMEGWNDATTRYDGRLIIGLDAVLVPGTGAHVMSVRGRCDGQRWSTASAEEVLRLRCERPNSKQFQKATTRRTSHKFGAIGYSGDLVAGSPTKKPDNNQLATQQ